MTKQRKERKKQEIIGYVENFPVFIWCNDGSVPCDFLSESDVWRKQYHDQLKKVRITVEEIQ